MQWPRKFSAVFSTILSLGCVLAGTGLALADEITVTSDHDNTLYEDALGKSSNGAGPDIYVGTNNLLSIRRGLIHFNLSGIPAGATITDVKVTLHLSKTSDGQARNYTLNRALASWGEGTSNGTGQGSAATTNDATWLYRFYKTTKWTNVGGDFAATASATTSVDTSNGNYSWLSTTKLVADVQGWVNNSANNFGWVVRGEEDAQQSARQFDSREQTTAAFRPSLTVKYTVKRAISGIITLESCTVATQNINFTLRQNGTDVQKQTVTLGADGSYKLSGVPAGKFDLHIKGAKWLAKNVAAIDTTNGDVSGVSATLPAGDVDDNNSVDLDDLGLLSLAFDTKPGDSLYDDRADLNCDGVVGLDDLGLLSLNFDTAGDK